MGERAKIPAKTPGKSSLSPQERKGSLEPRDFAVQRKESAVPGGELERGDLWNAYLKSAAGVGPSRAAGPELEEVGQGKSVGGGAPLQLKDAGEEVENRTARQDSTIQLMLRSEWVSCGAAPWAG